MGFVPLNQVAAEPARGFTPLASDPETGFIPLKKQAPEFNLLKTLALENPATAIGETALNLGSQMVALPAAGLAGLATAAGNATGLTDKTGAEAVQDVGEALTYQPRGEMGKMATEAVSYPFKKLAEAGQWAGGKTLDATGSPIAATAVDTAINALPMLVGPAKKGAMAAREKFASKPGIEVFPDALAPEGAISNPPLSEPARGFVPLENTRSPQEAIRESANPPVRIPGMVEDQQLMQTGQPRTQPGAENVRGFPEDSWTNAGEAQPLGAQRPEQGLFGEQRALGAAKTADPDSVQNGADRLGRNEGALYQPETQAMESVRWPGDNSQPRAGEIRGLSEAARTEAQLEPLAKPDGLEQRFLSGERELGNPRGSELLHPTGTSGGFVPRGLSEVASRGAFGEGAPGGLAEAATFGPDNARPPVPAINPAAGPLSKAASMTPEAAQARLQPEPLNMASPVHNSFAPGGAYVGFVNDAPKPTAATTPVSVVGRDKPIRREDILIPFARDLGASLYEGRVKGKNVMGFFRPGLEETRIKRHADIETAAHELAHLLDDRVPAISDAWRTNVPLREQLRSISYDQKKVNEGFAEGVRLWMTQPDALQAKAPMVYDWLENFAATDARYGPAMKKAQQGMSDWFGQDALDRARSKIGDHAPMSEAMNGSFDRFRQSVSDDLHGIYRFERELTGKLSPVGAYESARLSRASASIADGSIRFGYPVKKADGSFTYRGKGLQEIMAPAAERLDDALLYFVGRSAKELLLQGREHLFTAGEIHGMLGLETPEFRKAFAEYQAWNKGVLDFAEAQGVLNPMTRLLWKRTEYLPFHRVSQPGGMKGKPGDWAGVQQLTGGTENLKDILGNMIGNAAMLIDKAVKNEARLKVAELASRPGGGRFMTKIDPGSRMIKVPGSQVLDAMFKKYGIGIQGSAPAFFEFMLNGLPPAGGNVVAVLKNGKPTWFEVADPILYRALTSIDRPPMDWLTKWIGLPKRIGQMAITLTPDFMLANIARDTIMGSVMSRSGFRPVIDSLQGMRLRMTEDPIYKDYLANGGGLSSLFLDEQHLRTKLEKFYTRQGIDFKTVLDTPDKMLGFVETMADAFEMSTRLGEYKRAIDKGEHPRHAAYQGREVSTDFAMRGDNKALGFMYDTVMFLRPAVVSMDRLYRGVAHDPNKTAIGAKTAMIALSSVGLYLLNRQDQRYQDLPDWDRDSNWHFFVGDQHFRYPKIWEIGAVASTAERTVEKLTNSDPQGLGKDLARIIGNTFNLNFMPQILAPLAEQATNRNSFTHAPIETPGMEDMQPFLRSKPTTSETMKALGMASRNMPEALQVNPVRAEALLRGYLNTWGMYGLMLSDKALFNGKQPEMRTDQMPVIRRFYSQEPPLHTTFETQFYDMLGEANRLHGTMRELDKQNRPEIADEKERSPLASEAKPLGRAAKTLAGINKDMLAIHRSDAPPAEKRQKLDVLLAEKNAMLKAVVTDAKAAQRR